MPEIWYCSDMSRPGACLRVLKWFGAVTCIVIFTAWSISTRRAISCQSQDLRYAAYLVHGAIELSARPDNWQLETERYPPQPGWSMAEYALPPSRLIWLIERSSNRSWQSVFIPLWMPFAVFLLPTAILWYVDRHSIPRVLARCAEWLRPRFRRRMTLRLVLVCSILHALVVVFSLVALLWVYDILFLFHHDTREVPMFLRLLGWGSIALIYGTPLWGLLWAWGWVRLRNFLLLRNPSHYCIGCGYDLTGNVSGRCPECGVAVRVPTHEPLRK